MKTENNLIELAKLIFEGEPKSDYSIQLELENYNSLEDLFEVLLHIFVYGYKLKELDGALIWNSIVSFVFKLATQEKSNVDISTDLTFLT